MAVSCGISFCCVGSGTSRNTRPAVSGSLVAFAQSDDTLLTWCRRCTVDNNRHPV